MNTCETCKHWKKPDEFGFVGRELIVRDKAGFGLCTADCDREDGFYVESGDFASSNGHLETGSKFGCILHAP